MAAGGSLRHHLAAVNAGAGADLDDLVGRAYGSLVVLHHDHRVANVAQALQGVDHLQVVARMQADRRLVQHVEHTHQFGPNLHRQPHALRLAARECGRTAIQAEVFQTDIQEQIQPGIHVADHLLAGLVLQRQRGQESPQVGEGQVAQLDDVLAAHGDEQALRAQLGAVAIGTRQLHHHLLQILFHPGVRLMLAPVMAVAPFDGVDDAIVAEKPAGLLLSLLRVGRQYDREALTPGAVEHDVERLGR